MRQSVLMRRSILLTVAFAGLLLVIGVAAFAIWQSARSAQQRVNALHRGHQQAGAALAAIRASVYSIGILTRDYLLDPDPTHAQQYLDQFAAARGEALKHLQVLQASSEDEGRKAALKQLRSELEAYWSQTLVMLNWTEGEKRAQQEETLRRRGRRRQEVFALAEQVEQLITENFIREQERVTSADRDFRASLEWTTAIALFLGLVIAVATLARILELEKQSRSAESALRLLSVQLRTAQEEERKYLSRELHDQVGQMLTGVRMELAGLACLENDQDSEASKRIERAKGTVENTLGAVRDIAMLLRPSMLDDLGLTPAVQWLVRETSRSSGMSIRAEVDPEVDLLPDAHRTCLYRVVQEALTNASRHSGAGTVELALRAQDRWVTGTISDDGRGFERSGSTNSGLGLLGMEERVRELGGSFRLISALGRGTRVEIELPRPNSGGTERVHDKDPDRRRSRDCANGLKASA